VQLPAGWTQTEDDPEVVAATVARRGDGFVVECRRLGGHWTATVTRVRDGQRHRTATVVRPDLDEAIAAVDRLF
jgi:hypothetical protein